LAVWEKFLRESDLPPLVTIALAHHQFEAIHPFFDGNGRVGRLLITLFLIERKILPTPLLYLSAFFEAARRDY
jgi:Fic family protein